MTPQEFADAMERGDLAACRRDADEILRQANHKLAYSLGFLILSIVCIVAVTWMAAGRGAAVVWIVLLGGWIFLGWSVRRNERQSR